MVGRIGQHEFWNPKRREYVRAALRRGDDLALIAERFGVTRKSLVQAITRLGLRDEEAA